MLNVYQSNRTERLVDQLCANMDATPRGPFDQTVILAHSSGMGQWLKIAVAERTGIAAHLQTSLPATWIWQFCLQSLNYTPVTRHSYFDPEVMTLSLMRNIQHTGIESVRRYLGSGADDDLRAYQLASRLASMFDQYLLYRPDWMLAWPDTADSAEGTEGWLASLWRDLVAGSDEPHRARLYESLVKHLETAASVITPPALHVFGLSTVPPSQLGVLRALAHHCDVNLYFMNPCEHYWGDITSTRDIARRSLRALIPGGETPGKKLDDEDYFEIGNPLLSSMGKQGREFLELLLDIPEAVFEDNFTPPPGATMLERVQLDILNLEHGGMFPDGSSEGKHGLLACAPGDNSVQVHACHSALREVEVLFDQLQQLFLHSPGLEPHEIIVMTPNVSVYAPFIEALFNHKLPFSIADRNFSTDSPLMLSFKALLASPRSRLTAPEIMDLLEVPLIAARYNLLEEDLLTISAWIADSGVRWGLSGADKISRWDLPGEVHNTWSFGLTRMMVGFAASSDRGLLDGVLPFDVSSGDVHVLESLQAFIDDLTSWSGQLTTSRTIAEWQVTLNRMVETFYGDAGEDEFELQLIRDGLENLVQVADKAGYTEAISLAPFRAALEDTLASPARGGALLSGGITFASLVPMRTIPFRVVCLMGMNDGDFPRREPGYSFDLRAGSHRAGDRSRRLDDQYLFLEALLSARQTFYVSYQGRRITNNRETLPSILVSELVEMVSQVFRVTDAFPTGAAVPPDTGCVPVVVTEHPLQPFDPAYFTVDSKLVSFQQQWHRPPATDTSTPHFLDGLAIRTERDGLIELADLLSFYRNPARFFLRDRLGVVFEDHSGYLEDTEAFTLDALTQYTLAESALTHALRGVPAQDWQALMVARGDVLPGTPGRLMLDEAWRKAREISLSVSHLLEGGPPQEKIINLAFGNQRLAGQVGLLFEDRRVFFRTGQVRRRQLVTTWIEHLTLNATHPGYVTWLVDNKSTQSFKSIPQAEAIGHLETLIEIFLASDTRPAPFIPETSFTYLEGLEKSQENARKRAAITYLSGTPGSEGTDPAYQRLFDFPACLEDEAFEDTARKIYTPLLGALK